ncbi:uncharacterized protein PGTG_19152 [Puccinia graminis f. sp. tritici CRL 75-36-700-3]|uniref:CxC1-like cysteine cluster associated with KDZ transposases domain-containing protein n=1 Tax=Puccinia graminis f. sp. tritici (strain CRL 75-36-700-3 / race SCCL) TaxID=418459 RepID=E3L9B1_PUCGT|nr:uncharacterized protein PGTG_19152 [Puccinia graminis f. sp. tritici CRL 75-36-700-3]EFP93136.2 hypothetical protein PGTG_19152 [Puccinia graminis f. sp. tritici CRL 75-36-700-3]
MRGYEGDGGKSKRRPKKPKTLKGHAVSEEAERASQQFIKSMQPQPNEPNSSQQIHQLYPTRHLENETPEQYAGRISPDPIDPQVENLSQYFQNQHHEHRQVLEEKQWEEVYGPMFSCFYDCAAKTATWGDVEKWSRDWKPSCGCIPTRQRPVVLIDILSRKEAQVEFCHCQPDQVRLIQMGYIGATPKFPKTAFSIRLLQLHHILWKHCAIAMLPFSKAIDEFLDNNNPLILVPHNEDEFEESVSTRHWRKQLSRAVDAFREMLKREKELVARVMNLEPLDQLADICPKCYGPQVVGKREDEPDYILCMDGNFQHRRHLKASVEHSNNIVTPSLFVQPCEVSEMEESLAQSQQPRQKMEHIDRCTEQHTAANDTRNGTTWKHCDDTGLFGMACRHDQMIRMINIVKSGEKSYFPLTMINHMVQITQENFGERKKLAFLYDIGCNIEKGIIRRNQFPFEMAHNLLKFGTSVFHAYVHEWTCQLRYNPRLNHGWGMSDGEGMERLWSHLSPLISQLRYSTKSHRLSAIDLQEQWNRQRQMQLGAMENETELQMKHQVEELVMLEDQLRATQQEMVELGQTRRRNRTEAQTLQMEQGPDNLRVLESEIENIIHELGLEYFRNLPGDSGQSS